MSDQYMRDLLRVAVSQICQTIGYSATQTTPLELLQDALHKFLNEFARDLRRQTEHYNRDEPNLNDICLTLDSLDANVSELLDYITNVEPVPFIADVPKFPAHKDSNLNFLKPGSKEVLTRPVHIYEHLPPILAPDEPANNCSPTTLPQYLLNDNSPQQAKTIAFLYDHTTHSNAFDQRSTLKTESCLGGYGNTPSIGVAAECLPATQNFLKSSNLHSQLLDDEGRPTREISSVVMTTGGFISPAIEGKLPDSLIPDIIEKMAGLDALPPPAPPPTPAPPPPPPTSIPPSSRSSPENMKTMLNIIANTEKAVHLENVNNKSSSSLVLELDTAKQQKPKKSTIDSTSNSAVSSQIAKKHHFPPTTMASRLLKKAKKKSPNTQYSLQSKLGRVDLPPGTTNSYNIESSDKTHRKNLKMHQKLSKSIKSGDCDVINFLRSDETGSLKARNSNPNMPERYQMEKILKKHAKHKQKVLRQMEVERSSQSSKSLQMSKSVFANMTTTTSSSIAFSSLQTKDSKVQSLTQNIDQCQEKIAYQSAPLSHMVDSLSHTGRAVKAHSINEIDKNSPDKKTSFEIKLSTEPDRSKLNIFKKISKQKGKSISPNVNRMIPPYGSNESPVINLPSGTTITPAPSVIGRNVYPPDCDIVSVTDLAERVIGERETILCDNDIRVNTPTASQSSVGVFSATFGGEYVDNLAISTNKRKKRGRKPGTKNHPKTPGLILSPNSSAAGLKKPKKLKLTKNIYGPNFANQSELTAVTTEPLNLTNPNQFVRSHDIYSALSKSINEQMSAFQATQLKERKERKKNTKTKHSPTSTITSEPNHTKTNLTVPSKEEVNTINKKLMRMDTVLKPAPPMSSLLMGSVGTESSEDISYSPTKRRQQQQQRSSAGIMNMTPSFMSSGGPAFPNLPPSMVSMLPFCQFPPRPGLIPTSGLFPTGRFPNTMNSASSSSMLLSGFLPFSNLHTPITGKISKDIDHHVASAPTLQAGDRNYCNVAPLVPESMKLTPPTQASKSEIQPLDYPKTPKPRKSPTPSEIVSEALLNKLSSVNTPDSSSVGSKSIPATPGGISLNSFESLMRNNGNRSEDISPGMGTKTFDHNTLHTSENAAIYMGNVFQQTSLPTSCNIPAAGNSQQSTPTAINANEPIEVSDDSDDIPSKTGPSSSIAPPEAFSYASLSKMPMTRIDKIPTLTRIDEIFSPNKNNIANSDIEYLLSRDARRLKKTNKFSKNILCEQPSKPFVYEKVGVGKLAGGADLIPLSDTKTSAVYSIKSIPSTSLTAVVTPAIYHPIGDFSPSKIFDNRLRTTQPTAANASDLLQKKRKEHKKLKKLKDGKIKKKKEKKDKSKNKERAEKFASNEKELIKAKDYEFKNKEKPFLKKLKKEKKKEKQRVTLDTISYASSTLTMDKQTCVPNVTEASDEKVSNISPMSVSPPVSISPTATLVPKLTLKLGSGGSSCQSPTHTEDTLQFTDNTNKNPNSTSNENENREPSPELARISPLVTRPPKQKFIPSDIATMSSTAPSVVTSESLSDNSKVFAQSTATPNTTTHSLIPPPNPWLSGGTLTASSVLLPQQLLQTTTKLQHEQPQTASNVIPVSQSAETATTTTSVSQRFTTPTEGLIQPALSQISETSRPSSYIDAEGNRVWICPACGKVDDGSAMIGCDGCDAWYHWLCVGIFVAPKDNEDWFCRVCITRKKGVHGTDKKRKRNKKSKS